MACESRLRKLARPAGNLSQRMNRRFSPNRFLTRSSWRTVRETDVFPIPPAPMRAIGARLLTRLMILSTSPSRPKQALGGGGGDSPDMLCSNIRVQIYWYNWNRKPCPSLGNCKGLQWWIERSGCSPSDSYCQPFPGLSP